MTLFDSSGHRGIRRVIDVSGDGANNSGQLVVVARDEVVSKGITINGLPIMLKRPSYSTMDIELLDEYYEDCVIGGPAAFVVPVKDREKFVEAIRTKLVLEIAGLTPPAKVMKASAANPRVSPAPSASGCGRSAGGKLVDSHRPLRRARRGRGIALSARKCADDLHMRGVFELIDRRHALQPIAACDQDSAAVARESRRIAGHRNHVSAFRFCDLARLRFGALTRRIEHDRVEA